MLIDLSLYILEYANAVQQLIKLQVVECTDTGAQAGQPATDSYNRGVSWYTYSTFTQADVFILTLILSKFDPGPVFPTQPC